MVERGGCPETPLPSTVGAAAGGRAVLQALAQDEGLRATAGLWRARDFARGSPAALAANGIGTGFPALDALLADRGWPRAGLTELLCPAWGIGELRLLAPALATVSTTEARWIAWVDPPFVPYAPALAAAGLDLATVLLVRAEERAEAFWALEQAMRSGACGAVLGWPGKMTLAETRRLLLAARKGGAWGCVFRSPAAQREASAADLRLRLTPSADERLRVDLLKRRGGWPVENIALDVSAPERGESP